MPGCNEIKVEFDLRICLPFNKVLSILILLLLPGHGQNNHNRINVQKEVKE